MLKNNINIGFIGTGIIGLPMAKNLIAEGFNVYSYARDTKKHSSLTKSKLKVCKDIGEFYSSIDILILAVSDTPDVKKILIGKKGLIFYKKKPSIIIDMSTICPIKQLIFQMNFPKKKFTL